MTAPKMSPQELQFRSAAKHRGLILPTVLVQNEIARCPVDGKMTSNTDGAYLWNLGTGIASGWIQNWTDGLGCESWQADLGRTLAPKEVADFEAQRKADQAKYEAHTKALQAAAAKDAVKLWDAAAPCESHGYLTKKGVQSYGLRVSGDLLLIPAFNAKGELTTIQTITKAGEKRFLKGGKKQGSFFVIGTITDASTIYMGEGYATCASIHEVTGQPVVVTFDSGNLLSVSQSIRKKHPNHTLVICGDDDDDKPRKDNPGRTAALAAALAVGGQAVFPDFGPNREAGQTDFNDLHQAQGLEAVRQCITPRKRLEAIRWSEMRYLPIEPVEFDIEGISPKVPMGSIVSGPGHGKSILTVQMGVAKATGLPVLGFDSYSPGGVGIVALEDDLKVVHRRIAATVASYGDAFTEEHHRLLDANLRVLVRPRNQYASMSPGLLDMALAGLVGEIEDAMRSCEAEPALCYLDTLNSIHDGDENSAKETRPLIAAILGLNARLGCSVWVVHHLRKVGGIAKLVDRMDPELARGSSAIVGGIRALLQFGWITASDATKAGLDPDHCTRRYAVVGISKVNDGELGPWKLLRHTQNAGLWELVPNGSDILDGILHGKPKDAKGETPADIVLHALGKLQKFQTLDKSALAEQAYPDSKNPKGSLRTLISRLRKNGLIHAEKDELTALGKAQVSGNTSTPHCDKEA